MYKLSKSISRLRIKCKNEAKGCTATFPLSEEFCHSAGCQFEPVACPHQGCSAQVLRRDLEAHAQRCEHWRQLCPMGCGTLLSLQTQAQHNCYRQLRQEYEAQRQTHRAIAAALQRKMRKMQNTMAHMKRQIGLICESLEVMDSQEEAETTGEASSSTSSSSSS
ncbi:hypothetical protein AGOR_G00090340 [Albula goreensis]|uniref:TRAF-type domain-containing protein n=1 Tax=Albula goreensis TaxID=1534307 RepID=A0A8T3DJJ0_9TELE|nr:hypothetical protein AGOR_G00090340 [Albula goreensis]